MDRQEMIFKNTLIRGTMGMLEDVRMERYDEAMQYLMDVTKSTTEDDIRPLLRGKSSEELMQINIKVASYLKPRPGNGDFSKAIAAMYSMGGNYKGD